MGFPCLQSELRDYGVDMSGTDEHQTPPDALSDLWKALSTLAPGDALSLFTRAFESVLKTTDLAIDTLSNVNQAALRLHTLLDELEAPVRQMIPQAAAALSTLNKLNEATGALNDLARRFGPMASLFQAPKGPVEGSTATRE